MADGSIIIDTHIDNEQAQKELAALKKDIKKLSGQLGKKSTEKSAVAQEMQQADAAIEKTYQNIKKLEAEMASLEKINLKDNTSAEYLQAQTRIPQVRAELEAQQAAMDKQGQAADKVAARYEKVTAEVERISAELDEAKAKAGSLAQQVTGAGAASSQAAKSTRSAASETQKFRKRIVELTKSALIFSVLTKAITLMRDWLGRAAKSSDEAAAAFAAFKGTLQGLAAPILSSVLPALVKIVQVITQIISLISRGVAALFGMTNKQALESAESLNAEQEALEGVGGAASNAEKSLASFDEINKLSEPSSGGGGGVDGITPTFEEIELPDWMVSVAEKLASAFEKLKNAVNNIKENETFQKIVDFIKDIAKWAGETVITTVANSIEALADAIDLLDSVLDGDFIGAVEDFLDLDWQILETILTPFTKLFGLFKEKIDTSGLSDLNKELATMFTGDWIAGLINLVTGGWFEKFKGGIGLLSALEKIDLKEWFNTKVKPWFTKARWQQLWEDVKSFFVTGWTNIKTWWKNSALVVWWRDSVAPWFAAEKWQTLWNGVLTGVSNGWQTVKEWWNTSALVVWWQNDVAPYFTVEKWQGIWANVQTAFTEGWAMIQSWWSQSALVLWWQNDVAPWFVADDWSALWNNVKTGFSTGWETVKQWWNTTISSWWQNHVAVWFTAEKWSSAMSGISSAFSTAFTSAANAAIGVLNKMISWINQKLKFTIPKLEIMGETIWESKYVTLASLPSIPYLAQGAVIPPNQEFMAVLGDQKSGTNIETPLATMLQAFKQALNEGGRGGQRTIVLEVDKRELGRVTFDLYNAEAQRVGVSLGGA